MYYDYEKFLELCNRDGVKPTAVCDKINYSRGSLGKWKKGEGNPELKTIDKLCCFFNVPHSYFLSFQEEDEGQTYDIGMMLEEVNTILESSNQYHLYWMKKKMGWQKIKKVKKQLEEIIDDLNNPS